MDMAVVLGVDPKDIAAALNRQHGKAAVGALWAAKLCCPLSVITVSVKTA
jgi:hypothetical protein